MIDINDKNGKLTIRIEGGKLQNLITINEIVMDLSKTDEKIASAFVFGVIQTRGRKFVEDCLEREEKARKKADNLFDNATEEDIEELVKAVKKLINGEDEDE